MPEVGLQPGVATGHSPKVDVRDALQIGFTRAIKELNFKVVTASEQRKWTR